MAGNSRVGTFHVRKLAYCGFLHPLSISSVRKRKSISFAYCPKAQRFNHLSRGGVRVVTSIFRQLLIPLGLVVGGALLSGCSSEENIPLKKVDMMFEPPPKDFKDKRTQYSHKGRSSGIGHDPSGLNKDRRQIECCGAECDRMSTVPGLHYGR